MKTLFRAGMVGGWLGLAVFASAADSTAVQVRYEVAFKDMVAATQVVAIVQAAGWRTVSASFAADLPVFVAMHRYAEELSVTTRPDGTVERLGARIQDGPLQTVISGSLDPQGNLRVVVTAPDGATTSTFARADYDFDSLALFGRPPADFLSTNSPQRVLSVADGRVIPVSIQRISESDTFERQHLVSTHLVWTEGLHVSHSWHPERFSNLPRRYIRQTRSGQFTFTLIR